MGEILAALAQLASTALGEGMASSRAADARTDREKAATLWKDLQGPAIGKYIAPNLSGTALDNVSEDPRLKDYQMTALQRLQEMGGGGETPEDRAAALRARNQAAQYEKSQRDALMQNFAQRGAGGSGMELAQQLAAQQGGANRLNEASVNQAATAQQRALQAIQQSGQLASNVRGQEYGQQADRARAHDAIDQLNAGYNMWAQQGTNANEIAKANFRQAQAAGATGQYNANAGANDAAAAESRGFWGTAGNATGDALKGAYKSYEASQEEEKKKRGY